MQLVPNALVSVSLDGVPVPGFWDTKTGGNLNADVEKHRPGGQTKAFPIPGAMIDADDIEITRIYDLARDPGWLRRFRARVHRGLVVVSFHPTTADKIPVAGVADTFNGVLSGVQEPEFDNNAGDKQFWGITITIETPA